MTGQSQFKGRATVRSRVKDRAFPFTPPIALLLLIFYTPPMQLSTESSNARIDIIRTASLIALIGNAILATLKIVVGNLAGSLAVVGDGIDSSTDVAIAIMSLFVAGIISRPADQGHPWGRRSGGNHGHYHPGVYSFFAGGQLILNALDTILSKKEIPIPSTPALIVTIGSIIGKVALAYSQFFLGKKASSAMLTANGKNMLGDVMISSGVLLGVGASILFRVGLIDSIVAVFVGIWVIKTSIGIFLEVNVELMDGTDDTGPYSIVFEAVRSIKGAGNPHRTRMRKIAGLWDIDIDIEVDPHLTVREAHRIATEVERAIKFTVDGVYDIMVHVEPAGEGENHNEGYGLSEAGISEAGISEKNPKTL